MEYPTRSYRYTLCGSAYTGMVISLAWKYSQDMELLKDHIYPLLRELVIFHQGILSRDEKGTYHLDWSVPPEIFTLTRDECAMTAMFKVALETAIETSALLGRDAAKRKEWSEILAHYPPIPKTPEGAFFMVSLVSDCELSESSEYLTESTSTLISILSKSGPEILALYFCICEGVQVHTLSIEP